MTGVHAGTAAVREECQEDQEDPHPSAAVLPLNNPGARSAAQTVKAHSIRAAERKTVERRTPEMISPAEGLALAGKIRPAQDHRQDQRDRTYPNPSLRKTELQAVPAGSYWCWDSLFL